MWGVAKREGRRLPIHGSWDEPHGLHAVGMGPLEKQRDAGQQKAQCPGQVDEQGPSYPPFPSEPKGFSTKTRFRLERGFFFGHLWFPLGLLAALVLVFETTDLDLRFSDLFFDFNQRVFFWKNTWWATSLIHSGGKLFVAGLWVCFFCLLLLSFLKARFPRLFSWRGAMGFLMLSMILGPITVGCLKLLVNRPYPEHIKRYGGPLEYTKIFQGAPSTNKHYKGFPAGHASAGYGLMSLYFVLRERRPRLAPWGLAFGLALGTLFGLGQHVRGLHYASHNVWSAAICWFEALALYLLFFRGRLSGEDSRACVMDIAQ